MILVVVCGGTNIMVCFMLIIHFDKLKSGALKTLLIFKWGKKKLP